MDNLGINLAINKLKNVIDEEKITLSNIDSTLEELVDEIHLMNQLLAQLIKNNINN